MQYVSGEKFESLGVQRKSTIKRGCPMALLRAEPQCGRLAGSGGDVDCGRPPQPNMVSVAQATAKCGKW